MGTLHPADTEKTLTCPFFCGVQVTSTGRSAFAPEPSRPWSLKSLTVSPSGAIAAATHPRSLAFALRMNQITSTAAIAKQPMNVPISSDGLPSNVASPRIRESATGTRTGTVVATEIHRISAQQG